MSQTVTSKPAIVNGKVYNTTVTKQDDGSLVSVQKNGDRVVRTLETKQNLDGTWGTTSTIVNATAEEQLALQDPNSSLRTASSAMVKDAQSQIEGPATAPIQQSAYSQAGGGSGNTASATSSADQQTGNSIARTTTTAPATPKSALVYPLGMGSTRQDRIKFTAVEYIPSGNLATQQITFPEGRRKTVRKGTSVFLPIQASITDQNSADWQGGNINEIERQAVNLSTGLMNAGTLEQATTILGGSLTKAIGEVIKANKEVKVALAGEAVGIQNLLGRFGAVLNPNLELLFTGPQLRPFEFQFKMSAREQDEANNIKEIIKFFKQNMAPIGKSGEVFLRAPNTFFIEYMYGGATNLHPGINKIKECALLNCAVDYTPNGTYMTYEDGTMVSYTLSLSFQELEPIYSGDYLDNHSIGY